jgi:hypothetical protein
VFGLGDPTPSLAKWLGSSSGYATTFLGINHPDGKGGVVLDAYAWSMAVLYFIDMKSGIPDFSVPADLTSPSALYVYWQSNAVFYEDLSYLDLDLLN